MAKLKRARRLAASPTRKTVTVEQAADELGIGRNLGYRAAADGSLPTIRIGKRLLVPRLALDRLLAGEA